MAQYVIGLDFGGGGGRCLLLDVDSGETAFAALRALARIASQRWEQLTLGPGR